jgi:alpha-glucoside transport system substrate-binding protein
MNMRKLLVFTLIMVLLLAACGGNENAETPEPTEAPEQPAEVEEETDTGEADIGEEDAGEEDTGEEDTGEAAAGDSFLDRAKAGEFDGAEVTVFGKWTEGEGENFEAALDPFREATGIDVIYEGSAEFETLITVRVEGGDAPDVALFPQPALMAQFARDGVLVNLGDQLDTEVIDDNYSDAWINLGTVDSELYGLFYRASTKSLVWYPVEAFAENGYEAPETWDEMVALSDQIVEEQGVSPWCISIEHGGVTGWVATDWIEDVLLRTADPSVYDAWVAHEIPFNSPEILEAAEIVGDLWFNEDYVYGGSTGILTIFVGDTQTPMFEDPPQCWMHRQAGWIPDFWPEGTEPGVDSDFFYLPPIDEAQGKPVLGAGDVVTAFDDRPEVMALMEYLSAPEGAEVWVKNGGFISPNRNVPTDWYTNPVDLGQAQILAEATTLRFDASDLMPAEVGTGTFWSGMVDWVSDDGGNTAEVFQEIEDSWPAADTGLEGSGDVAAEDEEAADAGGYDHLQRALDGEFDGTEVTVFGKWTEGEGENFEQVLASFAEQTGIDIIYEGSAEFETLITVRVEGGDAPDIAGFPQPALMAEFVRSGDIIDYGAATNVDQLNADYSEAWTSLATVDGQLSAVPYRASTKSIVWYPVAAFEEAGYEVPQTWDELVALSDQIFEEQGVNPWCISIEHGGVTGWVATDWIEDVLLRTAPPETYDAWVNHEIAFNDPAVINAAEIVGDIWFNPDYVYGGTTGILTIFVGDTQTPMFEDPPQCWMHRQAGWIPDFWPEGTEAGVDSDFFYLPPIDPAYGKPVLGAGDFFSAFDDRPEVIAVMEYLASPEGVEIWVKNGGFISPNRNVPTDWYANPVDLGQALILAEATTLRFDASDLMPAEVGTGTFWSGMVDWVSENGENTEEVFQEIEDSWPAE